MGLFSGQRSKVASHGSFPPLFFLLLLISLAGCGEKGGNAADTDDAEGGEVSGGEAACGDSCGGTSTSCGVSSLTASESSWVSSLVINDGASIVTSADVTLSLTAHNDQKITGYYLSEDPATPSVDASGWVAVEETADLQLSAVSYQLSVGDGEKTLNGWFKDACGGLSPASSAVVTLAGSSSVTPTDPATPTSTNPETPTSTTPEATTPTVSASAPTGGLTLAGGAAVTNTLSVSAKVTGSGTIAVTHYALSETNSTPAVSSSLWNTIPSPSTSVAIDTNFSLSASGGEKTVYGWVKNGAGLVSAVFSDTITLQTTSLSAGLTINSGATFTTSRNVSLSLSGLGPVTITGYLVSESATTPPVGDPSWTAVSPPSSSLDLKPYPFDLSPGDGSKTVYLHLKDSANNTAKAQAGITLDATAPAGSLKLDSGAKLTVDAVVSAGITGTDAIGIVGYALSSTPSPVPSPAGGEGQPQWVAVTSTASLSATVNRTLTDLVGISNQYLWLKDAAGNVSNTISDGIEVVRIYANRLSHNDGQYTSIVTDSSNQPWISSYWVNGSGLLWNTFANGSFSDDVIDNSADVGAGTSIAAAPNGSLHIAYRDVTNSKLKYATNSSGSWVTETIEAGGISPSIGVDSGGKVHVSHVASNKVRYVTNTSGSWVSQVVLSNGIFADDAGPSTLAIGPDNAIHIVGRTIKNILQYASNKSGSWQEQTIASDAIQQVPSLAVSTGNQPFVVYSGSQMKLVANLGDDSSTTTLTSDAGPTSSVIVDAQGFLHVVYYEITNGDLKYATNYSGTWTTMVLDSSGDVGLDCDLAIDSNDRLHISYYDATNGDLKYATTSD